MWGVLFVGALDEASDDILHPRRCGEIVWFVSVLVFRFERCAVFSEQSRYALVCFLHCQVQRGVRCDLEFSRPRRL